MERNHRSFAMWCIAQLLPLYKAKGTKDRMDAEQLLATRKNEAELTLPEQFTQGCECSVGIEDFRGMKVVRFGEPSSDRPLLLYLHGGAFIFQADKTMARFCDKIVRKHHVQVVMPYYPMLPHHTYAEVADLLIDYYQSLREKQQGRIVCMGDSAGAGLAVSLTLQLKEQAIQLPDQLLLFSPWIDLEMKSDHYTPLRKVDPMLNDEAIRVYAQAWAGEIPLDDPRISPTFGDLTGLPATNIYVGTHEILFPDVQRFHEKLQRAGVAATLHVGRKLTHDYVLIHTPEQNEIIDELTI